ncbi:unnamed protein product [Chrysodeixis includens]|uniref:Monocarboxylate transporter n=1 Tax=Chrysodeixis includens TaxID=689277 RepID=A0A9N8KTR4_CHRIL|nr:unnamed protein product [Chrysodeixis includens]
MKQRVATDERPFQPTTTNGSGAGRDSPSEPYSEPVPEAALVVPPDGGWGWVVVAASFLCNFIIDGIILSGGALNKGIKDEFNITEGQVAFVNSLLAGWYLLGGPFVSALANKYGFRKVTIFGSIVSTISFASCYYAPNIEYLYIVYGCIGGVGIGMVFMPAVLTVGFYFEKWRALATGVALCGSGVGCFVMAPFTDYLYRQLGWRLTILTHAGMLLFCAVLGGTFRPINPVHVTLDSREDDSARRHEEAVEKLNSMLQLHHSKLDATLTMPPEMKFTNKVSPHTWMGVANNTRYPTAEEVFRGSAAHLDHRRSSATAGTIKNTLGNKPMFIDTAVAEKDEQDENNTGDNTEPLIQPTLRVMSQTTYNNSRRSTVDLARPLYRDDIFFGASLKRLPQYTSRTSIGYHLAVTHVPTVEETKEEKSGRCRLCPEAVRRALATLLDVSLFKSVTFLVLAISGFFTMLGFFVPFMFVAPRAKAGGIDDNTAVWLVSTIGVANIVGRIACGLISSVPRVSPLWVNNLAVTAGGIASMVSGLSMSIYSQYLYSVIFGLAVACFASLRSILVVEYLGLENLTNCYGLFLLFQGAGALLGAPIAGKLYDYTRDYNVSFCVSGGFLLLSAIMCYPVNRISRWEKARHEKKDVESIFQTNPNIQSNMKSNLPLTLADGQANGQAKRQNNTKA